jgi:hypothetical protein
MESPFAELVAKGLRGTLLIKLGFAGTMRRYRG